MTALWLLPFYPSPLRDDGYDIADYTDVHPDYGTLQDFRVFLREAHRRGLRVITELVLNHTSRPAPLVPAGAARAARAAAGATSTSGATRPRRTATPGSSSRISSPPTGPGTRWPGAYYWHRFYSHQPDLNFDNPAVRRGLTAGWSTSGWAWASTACGWTPCPTSTSARAPAARTCRRPTPSSRSCGAHVDAALPQPHAPGRGQPVARGRGRLLRRRRRVPHGLPLPAHAAAVHGHPHGGPLPHHRHPAADARHPGELPVGPLPAQPRRADAGDGHRRGARLHVPGLRPRPAGPHQPGHPPPPGPAAGQRPPQDRADERPALLAARHAGHLLRRRDRHGRQHLPGRPQRRAHAHAVERRPQRRLLARQSAAALPAGHHRPGVPLRGRQRRDPAEQPPVAAVVDEAADRPAQALPGLRPRPHGVPPPGEPQGAGLPPPLRGGDHPGGGQPLALRAVRGAGPLALPGQPAGGALRPDRVPADRRAALLADAGAATASTGSRWSRRACRRRRCAGWRTWVPPCVAVGAVGRTCSRAGPGPRCSACCRPTWPTGPGSCGKARSVVDVEIIEAIPVETRGRRGLPRPWCRWSTARASPRSTCCPWPIAGPDEWEDLQERLPNAFIARIRVREPCRGRTPGASSTTPWASRSSRPPCSRRIHRRRRRQGTERGSVRHADPGRCARSRRTSRVPEPVPLRAEQSNTSVALRRPASSSRCYRRVETGVEPGAGDRPASSRPPASPHMPPLAGTLEYRRRARRSRPPSPCSNGTCPTRASAWRYTLDTLDRYYDRVLAERVDGDGTGALPPGIFLRRPASAPPALVDEELLGYLPLAAQLLAQRTAELHLALASDRRTRHFAPEPFPRDYQRSLFQTARDAGTAQHRPPAPPPGRALARAAGTGAACWWKPRTPLDPRAGAASWTGG